MFQYKHQIPCDTMWCYRADEQMIQKDSNLDLVSRSMMGIKAKQTSSTSILLNMLCKRVHYIWMRRDSCFILSLSQDFNSKHIQRKYEGWVSSTQMHPKRSIAGYKCFYNHFHIISTIAVVSHAIMSNKRLIWQWVSFRKGSLGTRMYIGNATFY